MKYFKRSLLQTFNDIFQHQNYAGIYTTLLFHPHKQKINMCCHINQVCCSPYNTLDFRTD